MAFRGQQIQQKNWTDRQKLMYSMKLHKELHELYMLISQMAVICIDRNLKMVIENPYTQPHYLTQYWCLKPKVIDKDRREHGDKFRKPTQFWFINCEPKDNFIFEPRIVKPSMAVMRCKARENLTIQEARSEITPEYANRFLREFILDS